MELGIASSPEASGRNQLGRDTSDERPTAWRAYLRALGPGLVTGASDDDPSGVATYAQAGAQFRFGLLWTALITFPLMTGVQEICDRTALATGQSLQRSPEPGSGASGVRRWESCSAGCSSRTA